jgi:protein ImuA
MLISTFGRSILGFYLVSSFFWVILLEGETVHMSTLLQAPPAPSRSSVPERVAALKVSLRGLERSTLPQARPRRYVPTPFEALNRVLPHGGLPVPGLIELLAPAAAGAFTLALNLARGALDIQTAWAVVDPDANFYPPAAAACGMDPARLVVVRPPTRHAAWAFAHLLRCSQVGASFMASQTLDNMTQRRFQLAVERGGGLGFLLRPPSVARRACWGDLRLAVEGTRGRGDAETRGWDQRSVAVKILHLRGCNAPEEPIVLRPHSVVP